MGWPLDFFSSKETKMASNNQQNPGNQGGNHQGGNHGDNQGGQNSGRGFASMDADRQREVASEGGRAAHASGNAHEFNSQEAAAAGSKSHGGQGNQSAQGSQSGARGNASGGSGGNSGTGSTRGGTPEQHAEAGRQSHQNAR